ncbi:FkbM family methyltransferase [uncultured Roseovarius sp.]|uniref:FkbM family methyltransferase n=1 Tax=uncultured Roseovarius sp. TaxID=293344 RepID=UPI0026189F82|nr:FkbM family methyltransferase [uncultured Roseovarius sp.]
MKTVLKRIVPPSWRRRLHEGKRTHMCAAMKRIAGRGLDVGKVIDVGASDGRWTAQAMAYIPQARYVLVEANPHHKPALEAFCRAHPRTRFVLAAASNSAETIRFDADDPFGGKADPAEGRRAIEVPAIRLDDIVERSDGPFLIKLDTHGYEVPILEGAGRCLADAALVIIETYGFRIAPEALLFHEMVAYMRERGFGVVDMSDPLWRPGDRCFWQVDLYFQPLSRAEFSRTSYE